MTLDVNEPTDQRLVSELPSYIRADRVAINALQVITGVGQTSLTIASGTTSLSIGSESTDELSADGLEVVIVEGGGASTIATITGGTEGQLKIFIFQSNNITLTDGLKSGGALYLNQLPVLTDWNAQQDDVIALVNIDGDGATVNGYWKEVWRQQSVK